MRGNHYNPLRGKNAHRFLFVVIVVFLSSLISCDNNPPHSQTESKKGKETNNQTAVVETLVGSEEIILELTKRLKTINRSFRNLVIPHGASQSLFSTKVKIADLTGTNEANDINSYLQQKSWTIDKQLIELPDRGLWSAFLGQTIAIDSAKFYLINGHFDESGNAFVTKMGFAAHAQMKDGSFAHATAKIQVTWAFPESRDPNEMQIVQWKTKSFDSVHSAGKLFEQVVDFCIDDDSLRSELENSRHEEYTRRLIVGETVQKRAGQTYHLLFPEVTLEHPCVSVVDLDQDGLDDFFVGRQHLPSLFFKNLGNGKFKEIAAEIGLRFRFDCTCAVFADFDNDGDQDAFIGRARDRAEYLENDDGFFIDQTFERVGTKLPYMVSSISVADYNNDGLLDVYFSTYSPIESSAGVMERGQELWIDHFLDPNDLPEYQRRAVEGHRYTNMAGPPNLLLKNDGDRFVISEHNTSVQSWHKTFQGSWCDFDQDGDTDLYVCNDFAPDDFYENTENGFERVNDRIGLTQLGFGMGVSFADHNNDGQFDIYVSNMYSKAGTRITAQIENIDPKLKEMAAGNYLFEKQGDKYELVSRNGEPQDTVSVTGWSWGGQFTDFDNDGMCDIFVANGYYTAPDGVVGNVDL